MQCYFHIYSQGSPLSNFDFSKRFNLHLNANEKGPFSIANLGRLTLQPSV